MGSPEKPIDVELGTIDPSVAITNGEKVANEENVPLQADEKQEEEYSQDSRFTGLKKEELMEIANQPKWRRARWVLFMLFWVVWVAMLVAAVMIVINAPKCKPTPKVEWYQDAVVYKADPKKLAGGYKAMAKHMKYIKDQKTALLLTNVQSEDMKVLGDSDNFDAMVKKANEYDVKVLVELKIDSLGPDSQAMYTGSDFPCDNINPPPTCHYFYWSKNLGPGYAEADIAMQEAKFYKGTKDAALLNYESFHTHNFLREKMDTWIKRNIDGFMITDVSAITSAKEAVQTAWNKVQNASTEEKPLALMVEGSIDVNLRLSQDYTHANESIGVPTPLFVYKNSATKNVEAFKELLSSTRGNARLFSAYQNDASVDKSNQSLALTLLNLGFPGVPIIRSGEELGDVNEAFTWTEENVGKPANIETESTKFAMSATENLIKKRVADTLSKPGLRYDTQDEDTKFYFAETGNATKVIAYCRKWAKKPAVMVVSNIAENEEQEVAINFAKCDEAFKDAKILVSSSEAKGFQEGDTIDVSKFSSIPGYTTIVLSP